MSQMNAHTQWLIIAFSDAITFSDLEWNFENHNNNIRNRSISTLNTPLNSLLPPTATT